MNTNYFDTCTNNAEAKARYYKLVKEHHPDAGGDTATMQEINKQYADFLKNGAKAEARNRQQQAHSENRKSAADYHDLDQVGEKIAEVIRFALNLDGLEVELMGLWVWITGNTKAHKETFKAWNEGRDKADRLKWSPNKKAWYFAGVPTFNRKETTLDEIRETYGSQSFTREKQQHAGALHA